MDSCLLVPVAETISYLSFFFLFTDVVKKDQGPHLLYLLKIIMIHQ